MTSKEYNLWICRICQCVLTLHDEAEGKKKKYVLQHQVRVYSTEEWCTNVHVQGSQLIGSFGSTCIFGFVHVAQNLESSSKSPLQLQVVGRRVQYSTGTEQMNKYYRPHQEKGICHLLIKRQNLNLRQLFINHCNL